MGQDLSPLVHAWFCLHNESYLPHYTPGDPLLSPRPGLQSVQKQRLMNKNLEPDARKEPALLAWTSPVLGGGGTEVKRWRPKRPGHLAAILEPEPGKEEQREPRNSPKGRCFLRPRFLLSHVLQGHSYSCCCGLTCPGSLSLNVLSLWIFWNEIRNDYFCIDRGTNMEN